jgi:hypothetical protein
MYHRLILRIRCWTHLSASSVRTPARLTTGLTRLALSGCDDEYSQLSAGSGYDHLNPQAAALDATEKGHVGLVSYYTERGETPGAWIGSGLAGIDGVNAGDAVTAEQMRALFGAGVHPLATKRLQQLEVADLTDTNIKGATQLGAPFKVYAGEVSPFRIEVAKRIATRRAAAGQLADESVSAALRAQVRSEVAWEFFRAEHGRDPVDAREIAATIATVHGVVTCEARQQLYTTLTRGSANHICVSVVGGYWRPLKSAAD